MSTCDIVTNDNQVFPTSIVLPTDQSTLRVYNFQYNLPSDPMIFKVYNLTWKLEYNKKKGVLLTLVSANEDENTNKISAVYVVMQSIPFNEEVQLYNRKHLGYGAVDLKGFPLTRTIETAYVKQIYFDFVVLLEKPEKSISVLNDFDALLRTEKLTDVVLSVGNREFKAHKAILAARSPVFSAMFEHDMLEKRENRVEIEDVDSDMFYETLKYMYSGTVTNLKKNAPKLLPIAERYQIDELKSICETTMLCNIKVKNVATVLVLATFHNNQQLQEKAMKFISENWKDVVKTKAFENMVKTHYKLAIEIFREISKS